MSIAKEEKPIINCHTHIFKGKHVPPYLARTFVFSPLDRLLSTPRIIKIATWYRDRKNRKYIDPYREREWKKRKRAVWLQRNTFIKTLLYIVGLWFTLHAVFALLSWLGINDAMSTVWWKKWVGVAYNWLINNNVIIPLQTLWQQVIAVAIVTFFVRSGRKLLWTILTKSVSLLKKIPGKMAKDLIDRYMLMGRFAMYKGQLGIYNRLKDQYPSGTKFIVLPMDMEYMGAGPASPEGSYPEQMKELADIKEDHPDEFLPFVFVEPRRILEDSNQLKYKFDSSGKVTLEDCFIKEYIEDKKFSGFKIYPALGYYAFDEALLPLWKYAADNEIPIMTHCIKGTIFYRGKKKKVWDTHPIFKEYVRLGGDQKLSDLILSQKKNIDFSLNFTHPLNYLVLLKEELLRIHVGQCSDEIKSIFGYTDANTKLKQDLSHLKICFAHFGGEDQWERYQELDRFYYSKMLTTEPNHGIEFLYTDTELKKSPDERTISWKKLEDCWKVVDWYSIICSMLLQHDNVYADISYILHNEKIFNLLKETINNPKLGKKVLFGTDFYVVRNHKAEKNLLAQTKGNLNDEDFNLIARENPINYLG
ncbi:amidohydrolase family protein [uncultured Lacinutrix sp.]|uniref:amidohydrolase family protein n=1 Tax=uncultured Lacinutrix sp. TaxID=574032 RepID=UPI00261DB935|nr:amidohydrolase family protein [uncultured Lacinutrix sp.]